jgi:uncharacterized protein with GYD domain
LAATPCTVRCRLKVQAKPSISDIDSRLNGFGAHGISEPRPLTDAALTQSSSGGTLALARGVCTVAKFAVFFTFKGETIKGMIDRPSDRAAAVSSLCEAAGGHMEAYYLMFGAWDGFVIAEVPDSKAAAAISLAVSSTGAFAHIETHELLEAGELAGVLNTAGGLAYTAPGQ